MTRLRPKPNATPIDLAFGVNACAMALRYGRVRALYYLRGAENPRVRSLAEEGRTAGVLTEEVGLGRLDELTAGGVHQGVLVRLNNREGARLDTVLEGPPGPALALLLDQITDPQNVGAILRTSVAVGASAVVLPKRRGATLTPGVHRASAGLSFAAPVVEPSNLARAIEDLKGAGFWVVAAHSGPGAQPATTFDWPQRTALVLGSEGEGVSRLLLDRSDFRVELPMDAQVESLNVGVAAGVLMYLWRRQWPVEAES
ncbi:MAG: 23S rRNA (guanosine(2251)-2'-O)-methyltransferase RlmB [Chloroflexi bacterium]|nr:23S rRNA (guanosine(2251)-2'-O)-methyltransferase RlmB [Chloroflexota bacterium]